MEYVRLGSGSRYLNTPGKIP